MKRLLLTVLCCVGCYDASATVRGFQSCERLIALAKTPQDTLVVRAAYPESGIPSCGYLLDARRPR